MKEDATGLIMVHAHPYYDGRHTEDKVIEVLQKFGGTAYELPAGDRTSYGRDQGLYDQALEEKAHGKLRPRDSKDLVRGHEKVLLGGGFAGGCMRNTYDSLKDERDLLSIDTEIRVVPEVSYGGNYRFNKWKGRFDFGEIFTLEEIKDWDLEDLPARISEYLENENIESIL
ncbi:MAG: hypothetical protein ACLFTQ_01770 [Candidatus Aenigmatarchaeota archaeon]